MKFCILARSIKCPTIIIPRKPNDVARLEHLGGFRATGVYAPGEAVKIVHVLILWADPKRQHVGCCSLLGQRVSKTSKKIRGKKSISPIIQQDMLPFSICPQQHLIQTMNHFTYFYLHFQCFLDQLETRGICEESVTICEESVRDF